MKRSDFRLCTGTRVDNNINSTINIERHLATCLLQTCVDMHTYHPDWYPLADLRLSACVSYVGCDFLQTHPDLIAKMVENKTIPMIYKTPYIYWAGTHTPFKLMTYFFLLYCNNNVLEIVA